MAVNMSKNTSQVMADDLHLRLVCFENRVAFVRLLFPAEAKLAMEVADHPTTGYTGLPSKGSSGNLREVDLRETPSVQSKTLQEKVQALIKTVEMGRRFFPHCSEVLDKFLEDQMNVADDFLDKGTHEEQKNKKMSFLELKDDVQKAFWKDVAKKHGSVSTASSSSSSSP
ncbi:PREDICTED: regulatory protein NPR3-like [Fragaria vesca subsp. vesca]